MTPAAQYRSASATPAHSAQALPLRDGQYVAALEELQVVVDPRKPERRHVAWRLLVVEGDDAGRVIVKTTPAWQPEHLRWLERDLRTMGVPTAQMPRELGDVDGLEQRLAPLVSGSGGNAGIVLRVALATKGQHRRVYLLARVAARPAEPRARAWSLPPRTGTARRVATR